ncbi:MAG: WecB/TagA/CpsF family glycosyltransferase [Anaerolineae bacterium]
MSDVWGRVSLLGIPIDALTVSQLHDEITGIIEAGQKALILNVNVHCMNLAYERPWLRGMLNRARIVFCDGAGVMLGARLLGEHIPERITYADWLWQLAELASVRGYTMFFLGAKEGVARLAAQNLTARFPNLKVVGTHHGYFTRTGSENRRVVELINSLRPNILIVAFGMPLQEKWLNENWEKIEANVFLTGGACFDYAAGMVPRGPRWILDHGLEWLYRLWSDPRRLWRRYVIGNPLFVLRVLKQRIARHSARQIDKMHEML